MEDEREGEGVRDLRVDSGENIWECDWHCMFCCHFTFIIYFIDESLSCW